MDHAEVCILEYLYRDAGNYKLHGEVRVLGSYDPADEARLRATLCDDMFVPEQVGIEPLQPRFAKFGAVPSDDDHAWHELTRYRAAHPVADTSIPILCSKDALLQAFEAVERWDVSKSHLYADLSLG